MNPDTYGLNLSTGRGHVATCMNGQRKNRPDYVKLLIKHTTSEYESMFGKYQGDLIIQKSRSSIVITDQWACFKQTPLLFHWRLIATSEIAIMQRLIYPYFINMLTSGAFEKQFNIVVAP